MINIKKVKRTRKYRNFKRKILSSTFLFITCVLLLVVSYRHYYTKYDNDNILNINMNHRRKLLAEEGYEIEGASYPTDAFTESQLKDGAVILHIIGLFYMFLAIAIVCDEFFVPAIEVIVDRLNLSPDVAGATFMAAGGSAPELFTAFIGTFISAPGSAVGFGTIVGSAVFNVLFVIGCCAIFSSGDLVLTWYPFGRDSLYYCISLCVLAGFFVDGVIWLYEALILFSLYFGYITLMFNNAKLYSFLERKIMKKEDPTQRAEQLRPPQSIQTFSVSLFKMMTADANIQDIAGIHMVARIKGDVKATFRQVDADGSGFIDKEELRAVLQSLGGAVDDEAVDKCYKSLDENDDGKIDFDEFSRWYLKSENRIEADVAQIFSRFDHDGSGKIEIDELENLVRACQGDVPDSEPTADDLENARKILDENNDGIISKEEFLNWYKSSIFFEKQKKRRDTIVEQEEEEENEAISLKFPQSWGSRILYIISAPIMYTLYFTVPDVRKKKWTSWYPAAFLGSIGWLAVYSYLMVWWATVFGRIAGIPDAIMGLTLLAAGTSVPDLLTSIIVARQGHADMAVSSSIGSNIFDILVGLPLPWIIATITPFSWLKIEVGADSIFLSILILFAMLGCVLAIIYFSKWRLTKTLGYAMFVLYFLFVIQDILRNKDLNLI